MASYATINKSWKFKHCPRKCLSVGIRVQSLRSLVELFLGDQNTPICTCWYKNGPKIHFFVVSQRPKASSGSGVHGVRVLSLSSDKHKAFPFTSSVFVAQVWKSPDITQTDTESYKRVNIVRVPEYCWRIHSPLFDSDHARSTHSFCVCELS